MTCLYPGPYTQRMCDPWSSPRSWKLQLVCQLLVDSGPKCQLSTMFTGALTVTSPLVTKILIQQIVLSHDHHEAMEADLQPTGQNPAKPAGYGIGVAIGLAVMLFSSAVFDAQAIQRAQMLGALMRAAVRVAVRRPADDADHRRDLSKIEVSDSTVSTGRLRLTATRRLSGKARLTMTNGRINNMVTADASYIVRTQSRCGLHLLTKTRNGHSTIASNSRPSHWKSSLALRCSSGFLVIRR